MKKTFIIIAMVILFVLLDLCMGFMTFFEILKEEKTIKVENQGEYMIDEIKEHFKIDYDIKKITFWSTIPDGYILEIYNENGQKQKVFEDNHEDSEIYDYFRDEKADIPKHLVYLISAIILEIAIIKKYKNKEYQLNEK